jgi:hypothetical protein
MGEEGSKQTGTWGGERNDVAQRFASKLREECEDRYLQLSIRLVHISKGCQDKHSRARGAVIECAQSG